MIRHILKIIWNERRINTWLLLEYILVFCILWFSGDFIYNLTMKFMESEGINIDHVYQVNIDYNEDMESEEINALTSTMMILRRIEQYPLVESVSLSYVSIPYTFSMESTILTSDTVYSNIKLRSVSSGFFDVFKIKLDRGHVFEWSSEYAPNQAVITPDSKGKLGSLFVSDIDTLLTSGDVMRTVVGVTESIKKFPLGPYESCIFVPIKSWKIQPTSEIIIRVHPEVDKDFEEKFMTEMGEQLNIGKYHLNSVVSYKEIKNAYMEYIQVPSMINSTIAIILFVIVNIFMGVLGSFWFRTQNRKSEIGVRIALGASKKRVKNIIIIETFLLLLIASIISTIICLNVEHMGVIDSLGLNIIDETQSRIGQYFINYTVTFIFLSGISFMSVWYPLKQVSAIQPVEALHEE